MDKNYIYSQSWEDGEIDLNAYQINENSKILMITTGGDNVLNYLAHGVDFITTVDMNCNQNYLLEIKKGIILSQTRENSMKILGKSDYDLLIKEWDNIKIQMSDESVKWWNNKLTKFKSFWRSGIVGIFSTIINFIFKIFNMTNFVNELNNSKTLNEQRNIYWNYSCILDFISWFVSKIMIYLIPFIGVPSKQYELHDDPKFIGKFFKRVFFHQEWSNNYFYIPYTLCSSWSDNCCPSYLKEDKFEIVKKKLEDKNSLEVFTNRMDLINTNKKYNRIILLDHLDWMDDDMIIKEIDSLKKFSSKDCLFCFRSFSNCQPFSCLRHMDYVLSEKIFDNDDKPFKFNDRVAMYNSIHTFKIPDDNICKIKIPNYELNYFDSFKMLLKMVINPITGIGMNNKDFMEHYYKSQSLHYDSYRHKMLHGKKKLMYSIPWHKMKNKKILLLAGGTGDLTEYFSEWISEIDEIVISDISQDMINIANNRIEKYKWNNVKTRIEDVLNNEDILNQEIGKYDYVILTYSLTMIPNWSKALECVKKYLKNDGCLAISDFSLSKYQSFFSKIFWKLLFINSNIFLNENHIRYLKKEFEPEFFRIENGDFPYLPVLTCPYYYGLFRKK